MMSSVLRVSAPLAAARSASPFFAFSTLALACACAHAQVPTLPPVVVTATRFADDPDRLTFGVSVLTAEQIRDAGVTTVNEALMKLLGVAGRQDFYGGGDYVLDLRGFGSTADSNQVVILDGVRLTEADTGGTRLAGIPIDSIETIEVIRGNAAVLYGEGASAGAIVITTKAARGAARSSARGYLAMGSHSLLDARTSATLAQGGFSLDASLAERSSDGHRRNFHSSVGSHALSMQWRNDWLRVGVRHAQDELDTGLPGALSALQYEADPSQTNRPTDRAHIENLRNGVFASATLGNWQFGIDAGKRHKLLDSVTSFPYAYNIEAQSQSVKLRHSARFGAFGNTLTAGIDRNKWTRVVPGGFGGTAEQESKAFYLKEDLSLPTDTTISIGARRENIVKTFTASTTGIDDGITAWDVGAVQPIGRAGAVYARVGRSFRFANADEFSYTLPATTLRPQLSRDVELGTRLSWTGGKGDLRLYRSTLRDEIGYDPVIGGFGANVNFEPTRRQGVEVEVNQALSKVLRLRLNAAGREAKFTAGTYEGKDIALTPRYTASIGLDWQPLASHKLGGLLNSVSSQSPDFANACKMPGYTTAGLRYAFSSDNVELSIGLNNLADRKYYSQAYTCTGGVTNGIYPEAGRTVVAAVRVSL